MEFSSIDTLEYLLKISNEKKKKEPSKIERGQFLTAWVSLASDEGYSERAERYLYNCVSYCGAKPFKQYIDHLENKEQGIKSFFAGKMYGYNAETTFRLLVNLFALLLNDPKTTYLTPSLIMHFPHACYNKDKKRLGKIEHILLNYFFAELAPDAELVPLAEIGVKKPVFITDFISAMEISLEKIDTSKLSKNKVSNIAKVRKWMEEYQQATVTKQKSDEEPLNKATSTSAKAASAEVTVPVVSKPAVAPAPASVGSDTVQVTQDHPLEEVKEIAITVTTVDNAAATSIVVHPADSTTLLIDLLDKAEKAATIVKTEGVQQKNKIDTLSQALLLEQEKLQRANQQITEQQATIADLRKKLAAAEGDALVLKQNIAQRDIVIAEKNAEIAERIKMADVLIRDRSRQADETLQRLASEIRNECSDFYDAIGMEMSVDLGEILRDKLTSILSILEKGGMKIK